MQTRTTSTSSSSRLRFSAMICFHSSTSGSSGAKMPPVGNAGAESKGRSRLVTCAPAATWLPITVFKFWSASSAVPPSAVQPNGSPARARKRCVGMGSKSTGIVITHLLTESKCSQLILPRQSDQEKDGLWARRRGMVSRTGTVPHAPSRPAYRRACHPVVKDALGRSSIHYARTHAVSFIACRSSSPQRVSLWHNSGRRLSRCRAAELPKQYPAWRPSARSTAR